MDIAAALLTGTSTVLLAMRYPAGFVFLMAGSVLWACVAYKARYKGRPIWWQVGMSAWTLCWAVYGLLTW